MQANVSLYKDRGELQLIVQTMEPAGLGALQKAFEQLKEKLSQEGLFDEMHKKAVPEFPRTIGDITSPTGAAVRDILTTLKRRYPMAGVIVYPVPVQGTTAAGEIAGMIATANLRNETDVLILAQGGSSLEDLLSFNEETVARTVYASDIPIVTGIGHEIDFTITDFVADLRAPTPTPATEHVSRDFDLINQLLTRNLQTISRLITNRLQQLMLQTHNFKQRIPDPQRIINDPGTNLRQSHSTYAPSDKGQNSTAYEHTVSVQNHCLRQFSGENNRYIDRANYP